MSQDKNNSKNSVSEKVGFYFINAVLILICCIILNILPFQSLNFFFLTSITEGIQPRDEIVIVVIDDKSIEEFGALPWDRSIFAHSLENLTKKRPKVVGINMPFIKNAAGDEELEQVISRINYPLVLASKILDGEVVEGKFDGRNVFYGFENLEAEADGEMRKTSLVKEVSGRCIPSFAFAVYSKYLGLDDECDASEDLYDSFYKGEYFNYTKSEFEKISFYDLYVNKVDKDETKNKIMLIGPASLDTYPNSFNNLTDIYGQEISTIEVQANIINSFLSNKFRRNFPLSLFYPFIVCVTTLLLFFYGLKKSLLHHFGILLCALLINYFLASFLFEMGINWPFVQVNVVILMNYFYVIIYKYIYQLKENKFFKKALSRYTNPSLLNSLSERHELLDLNVEKKIMTVLFSDIRGFTNMTEKLSHDELINLLNEYLGQMCEVIQANGGTIDKFLGDSIMAFWNGPIFDPYHQIRATVAALQMIKQLTIFNKTHTDLPKLRIGIGLNSGEMAVGNIGSKNKFDYTVMGDNVNLASRLEGLTKKYGISIIMSDSVTSGIPSDNKEVIFRQLDEVIVKGKTGSVKIFEPLLRNEEHLELKAVYEKAFRHYQVSDFKRALKMFRKLEGDNPSCLMIERIGSFNGDKNFIKSRNGVWAWLEK